MLFAAFAHTLPSPKVLFPHPQLSQIPPPCHLLEAQPPPSTSVYTTGAQRMVCIDIITVPSPTLHLPGSVLGEFQDWQVPLEALPTPGRPATVQLYTDVS